MAIKFDLKDSELISTMNGIELSRTAIINEVDQPANAVLLSVLNDASVPSIGTAHPVDSTLVCSDVTIRPLAKGTYKLTIKYVNEKEFKLGIGNAHVTVTSSTVPVDVFVDRLGNALKIEHSHGSTIYEQPFTAEIEQPQIHYEYTYITTTNPYSDTAMIGTVNSGAFNGHAEDTVLCTAVDIEKLSEYDSGAPPVTTEYWRVRLRFVYNPAGYKFVGRVRPWYNSTAIISGPIDLTDGTATFEVYQRTAFSTLGLPELDPPPPPP